MAKFKVNGLKQLQRELTKMQTDIPKQVEAELKVIADGILADALQRVPVDTSQLKASAFVEKIEGGYTIGFSAIHSPWVEFGTGALVEVPTGFESYAMEFFISGKGHGRPQPFLFPAFLARRERITEEISVSLGKYLSQF